MAVADVVLRVLRLLEAEAAEKNIRFQSSLASNLPEIRGDPERMEQVFLNNPCQCDGINGQWW